MAYMREEGVKNFACCTKKVLWEHYENRVIPFLNQTKCMAESRTFIVPIFPCTDWRDSLIVREGQHYLERSPIFRISVHSNHFRACNLVTQL